MSASHYLQAITREEVTNEVKTGGCLGGRSAGVLLCVCSSRVPPETFISEHCDTRTHYKLPLLGLQVLAECIR
jgi:hypothetical protein